MARCMEPGRDVNTHTDTHKHRHTRTQAAMTAMLKWEKTQTIERSDENRHVVQRVRAEQKERKKAEIRTFVIERMQNAGARNVGKHVGQPINLMRETRRDQKFSHRQRRGTMISTAEVVVVWSMKANLAPNQMRH